MKIDFHLPKIPSQLIHLYSICRTLNWSTIKKIIEISPNLRQITGIFLLDEQQRIIYFS